MSFSWKQYEGQVINNTFPLQRYLGGSVESAVFLTQLAGPQSSRAVLKLIPEGASADLQLSLWRRASKLAHPNLIQLYQGGRCRLADMDLLYLVMEYAEENLSEILPQRALTPSEARDMIGPVLDALSYLHAQGLVHSHLKPSNILATSDQVKLSTDRLFPAGEIRKSTKATLYDAPESANQALTAASDIWSLGVILIEVLTQRGPGGQAPSASLLSVPESLPQPFREIAQHAVERDPRLRWSVARITASLNPRAAAAAQSASPLSVPLSPVAAIPAAKMQAMKPAPVIPPPPPPVRPAAKAPKPAPPVPVMPPLVPPLAKEELFESLRVGGAKRELVLPSYVVPLAVAVLVVLSIIALPKILRRGAEISSTSTNAASRAAAPGPEAPPTSAARSAKPGSSAATGDPPKPAAVKPSAKDASQPQPASPSPASFPTQTKTAADAPRSSSASGSGSSPGHGEVLEQILPDVPDKALATISGKVRVTVLARVDAAGNVSDAEFENPGPSKFFADAALKAVRRWEFSSPEVGGRSVPSEWLVRFEFSASGVQAFPTQTSP